MDEPISNLPKKEQGGLLTIYGDPDVEEPFMFERGIYLSLLYCLYYVKDISIDILEGKVPEEIHLYLNEEYEIRLEDNR